MTTSYQTCHHLVEDWETVASYQGRYYGDTGDELGTIPISIAQVRDPYTNEAIGWIVAETPEEATEIYDTIYATEAEAIEAAESLAEELDETPDLDAIIAAIEAADYFELPSIIPDVVAAMTGHSQGYILITPDIGHPVGSRWTTNGYLEVPYVRAPATMETAEQAAEWLLAAVGDTHDQE